MLSGQCACTRSNRASVNQGYMTDEAVRNPMMASRWMTGNAYDLVVIRAPGPSTPTR